MSLIAAAPQAASAEEAIAGVVLFCTPATSDFRIASDDKAPARTYESKQALDASTLIGLDMKTERRTGTQTKNLQCGDVAIGVSGGFYNSNPAGELGAADDFAKLAISRRANRVEVSLLPDACADAFSPRAQAAWGEHRIQAVEGHRVGGSYQVTLFKTACETNKPYTQVLTWPSN